MPTLFDPELRALRRDRAHRVGVETFLHDRAFGDILERLAMIGKSFERALLVGCPNPDWPAQLGQHVGSLSIVDPGAAFADAVDGHQSHESSIDLEPESVDLVLAVGTLDTVDALPEVLTRFRFALRPDGLLIGAMAGGDSLPLLRQAMAAADAVTGKATPHIHPRIDPASLTQLLANAGLAMPVVDVDQVRVRYSSFDRLVGDLRAMGATNILNDRSRTSMFKEAMKIARKSFQSSAAPDGKSDEVFEILHFMGWAGNLPESAD